MNARYCTTCHTEPNCRNGLEKQRHLGVVVSVVLETSTRYVKAWCLMPTRHASQTMDVMLGVAAESMRLSVQALQQSPISSVLLHGVVLAEALAHSVIYLLLRSIIQSSCFTNVCRQSSS